MSLRERLGLPPARTDNLPRPGRCLRHGIVTERCCAGFEADRPRPFLRLAIDDARPEWVRRGVAKDLTGR